MLVRVLVWPFFCLSVFVSSHISAVMDGQIELVLAWRLPSFYLSYTVDEIQVSTKAGLRVLPSGTLFYTPDEKFCHSVSIVATCCQLSSTKVDACFIINWTVVWLLL